MPRSTILLLAAASLFAALGIAVAPRGGTLAAPWALGALLMVGGALVARREDRAARAALGTRDRAARELEARLTEQSRTVDALADGLDAALFICDTGGAIRYANPPARRLFGHDAPIRQTLLAATLSVELERLLAEASGGGSPRRAEIAFAYPHDWIGLVSAWREEGVDRVFVSVYEITELRRLERSRKDFVANVSHELRTPMTIIRNFAETLLDEDPPTPETSNRMLPRIIAEVDRLSTITQDLLELSVAESSPVWKQPCDLGEIVRGVAAQLQPKAVDKELVLTYEGPDALPVQANPGQIRQVVLNLVDNALNYTARGSVDVALGREGPRATLTVRDTGIGIATEHVERVFERFYRVDRGRSRATGGTGLGLSIVRHIVEAHGGTVRLESALNRGSTFRVELPVE